MPIESRDWPRAAVLLGTAAFTVLTGAAWVAVPTHTSHAVAAADQCVTTIAVGAQGGSKYPDCGGD